MCVWSAYLKDGSFERKGGRGRGHQSMLLDLYLTSSLYSLHRSVLNSTYIYFFHTEKEEEPEEEDDHFDSVEPLTKSQLEARKISGSTYTLSLSHSFLPLIFPPFV